MPDANGEVGTQSVATQPEPTFSRQELGAGLLNNIPQLSENARGDLSDMSDMSDVSDELRFSIAPEENQPQTAAFKKWFDGSKVVDKNGKALVV
jgi:hypothetical protein